MAYSITGLLFAARCGKCIYFYCQFITAHHTHTLCIMCLEINVHDTRCCARACTHKHTYANINVHTHTRARTHTRYIRQHRAVNSRVAQTERFVFTVHWQLTSYENVTFSDIPWHLMDHSGKTWHYRDSSTAHRTTHTHTHTETHTHTRAITMATKTPTHGAACNRNPTVDSTENSIPKSGAKNPNLRLRLPGPPASGHPGLRPRLLWILPRPHPVSSASPFPNLAFCSDKIHQQSSWIPVAKLLRPASKLNLDRLDVNKHCSEANGRYLFRSLPDF